MAAACVTLIVGAQTSGTLSVNIPVTQLQYGKTGVTDGVHGELQAAPAYGDFAHGPHGTFIKMPAAFVSPIHIHTSDYWGSWSPALGPMGFPEAQTFPSRLVPIGFKGEVNAMLRSVFPRRNASSSSTSPANSIMCRTQTSSSCRQRVLHDLDGLGDYF